MWRILILVPLGLSLAQPSEKREPKELIETLRIWRLTEELKLSEEQASKLFPKLRAMREAKREFRRERMEILKSMKKELKSEKPREKVLKEKIESLKRGEKGFREKEEGLREEISRILTIEQQARLLVFQEKFDKEIRTLIRKVKRRLRRE